MHDSAHSRRLTSAGVSVPRRLVAVAPAGPDRFLNRELSWLEFDRRVLEAAADPSLPLLERVKLCAIVSSNLDEFFAVRMAGLHGQVVANPTRRAPDGRTSAETLATARKFVVELQAAQDALWRDELQPALAAEDVRIVPVEECAPRELRALTRQFDREVKALLTPIAVGPAAPFPYISSLTLSIGAIVSEGESEPRFVRVNVPADLARFLDLGRGTYVAVEDAIMHHLPQIVGSGDIEACAVFRITRDADFAIETDADDLVEAVEMQLRKRRFGDVVRLEVAVGAPRQLIRVLKRELRCDDASVYRSAAPIGLAALRELSELKRPELLDKPWRPVTRRSFANRTPAELLARIRRRDVLVHHPYDSFETSVQAFVSAARDPKVASLKATVYRTGNPSPTLASLVETAEEGKQAVCVVELQARFEERRNIEWSRALERAGVDVVYGMPELKMHAKLAMLVRHEGNGLRRYVHIGTGNYHASNASNYEDFSLFTADEDIGADVAEIFNAITGLARPAVFRKLLVGPWFLREGILDEIARVVRAAQGGETARIRIKVNALVDPEMVDALYAASNAGVTVEVITRGICILRPGVPGLSDRITVRSVLGRFLEHSRILSFQTGDRVATWIGSADLMPRNLDRRIEVLAPVEDSRLRLEIAAALDALLADTRLAWELDSDGVWQRREPAAGKRALSAQEALMANATKRTKKSR